ncbi:hypothetical protein M9H77_22529 [Catharanthus roseus]|uniref:Uncharacterized protein n=1 Tax=Catharanthus roseus TaxID=4058 RepID=A0ACC0AR54_CATRO|nr:hypothetical protein M9H77_22529 [Catharanthus roseus]
MPAIYELAVPEGGGARNSKNPKDVECGRPPSAPRPRCLQAPLLTPQAPSPVRAPGDGNAMVEQGTSVAPIGTMHLRIIVGTFFANTAICEGSVGGCCITTEVISSTSCNMEV